VWRVCEEQGAEEGSGALRVPPVRVVYSDASHVRQVPSKPQTPLHKPQTPNPKQLTPQTPNPCTLNYIYLNSEP
jgi:hypothetical protein